MGHHPNVITGDGGDNLLGGFNGKDEIFGLGGNDDLVGFGGADTLDGGAGQDTLEGGGGADTYVVSAIGDSTVAAPDVITKIKGDDAIDLHAIDADTGTDGDQAFHLVTGHFSGAAGELLIYHHDGLTHIQGDVDGDGVADFEIDIQGNHTDFTHFVL